jgi:hypothetical protein
MKTGPMSAKKAPVADSMINSHCHPASPTFDILSKLLIFDVQNTAPGKNGASARPRKQRTTSSVSLFVTPAVVADRHDHTKAHAGR